MATLTLKCVNLPLVIKNFFELKVYSVAYKYKESSLAQSMQDYHWDQDQQQQQQQQQQLPPPQHQLSQQHQQHDHNQSFDAKQTEG